MTKPQIISLGREFPFSLHNLPNRPSDLLVAYRNGLEQWSLSGQSGTRVRSHWGRVDALAVLTEGSNPGSILVAGEDLSLLGTDFQTLSKARLPGSESIRTLLYLGPEMILAMDDEEQVTPLFVHADRTLSVGRIWPTPSLPVLGLAKGKAVLCLENGKLQERDAKTGMALRAWTDCESVLSTGSLTKVPSGHEAQNLITFHQDGQAHCWDLSGRELLFTFTTPLRLVSGRFNPHQPHKGALLSDLGDLLVFSVLDGGKVKPVPPLPGSVVDVAWTETTTVGLDENGSLWAVDDSVERLGGTWSGWSTTALSLDSKRTAVGTAEGSLVLFDENGNSPAPPLRCHEDAVVALYRLKDLVVSLGADCTVCLLTIDDAGLQIQKSITERAGVSVVSSCWDETRQRLYLALEEGELLWIEPESGRISGSLKLEDHRIEEVSLGGLPGQVLILTDRGSLKQVELGL